MSDHSQTHDHSNDAAQIHNGAADTIESAREIGEKTAEAGLETARRTSKAAEEMASKNREHFAEGMRAFADACAPMAEAGKDAHRRVVEASSRINDLYSEAAEGSARDVQALTSSCLQLGHGLLRLQKGYLNAVQQSLTEAKHHPQDLLACRSVTELAEVQRDFFLDGINFMVQSSTTMMQMAGEIVQNAAGPLENRTAEHLQAAE
jgi:hypothetical protein